MGTTIEDLEPLEDPRRGNAERHSLHDIMVIALCTILCGGETCTDMSLFGQVKQEFLESFLPLKNGIPSHDTFSRVFRLLDPEAFQKWFLGFMGQFAQGCEGVLAVDDKSNEITAVPKLLELLALPGMVVTADAMHCQKQLSQQVVDHGADYVLALKGNQESLNDDVRLFLDDPATVVAQATHPWATSRRTLYAGAWDCK